MAVNEVERLEIARKKRQVLEMRLESKSYRAIAETMGLAIDTVRLWIKETVAASLPEEDIDEIRRMETAKIDLDEEHALTCIKMLLNRAANNEVEGKSIFDELEAIRRWKDTLMQLRKQRALLLGLNKPVIAEQRTINVKQ